MFVMLFWRQPVLSKSIKLLNKQYRDTSHSILEVAYTIRFIENTFLDLFIVDDGAGGTNRKSTLARMVTLMRGQLDDPTALSIGDLKNLSTILDVASTRGAFKANEMAGVGFLYNKLQAFLAKVAPEQTPEGATAGAPTTVAPATAEGNK